MVIAFWTGRAISETYQTLKESVARACGPHAERFDGPVHVRLFIVLDTQIVARKIIDSVLDALQAADIIKDESQVRRLSFYREPRGPREEDHIGIIVTEIG